jgi:hypothetical protein
MVRASTPGSIRVARSSHNGSFFKDGGDHSSDIAQLGSPNLFEQEDILMFCSQSAISIADSCSEVSSQLDFLQYMQSQCHAQLLTGPNPTIRRGSSIDTTQQHTGSAFNAPFVLSPLNEYDEEYENPLNKAMIVECTVTGFVWSKRREDNPAASPSGPEGYTQGGPALLNMSELNHSF